MMLRITIQLWPRLQLLKKEFKASAAEESMRTRCLESFEALERLLQKFSKSHKSHVKNRNKKITLVEKIAKIAKQDNVLD